MIKVIVLKDQVADKSTCFAKACVESNGFTIDLGVGFINKPKGTAVTKGTIAFELPDIYLEHITIAAKTFENQETGELSTVPYITIK